MGAAHRTTGVAQTPPVLGLTAQSGQWIRNGVLAIVTASALGLLVVAPTLRQVA